eukprot:4132194-Pyramimonas_sp.AAC.1
MIPRSGMRDDRARRGGRGEEGHAFPNVISISCFKEGGYIDDSHVSLAVDLNGPTDDGSEADVSEMGDDATEVERDIETFDFVEG